MGRCFVLPLRFGPGGGGRLSCRFLDLPEMEMITCEDNSVSQ